MHGGSSHMPTPEEIWETADLPARRLAGVALNRSSPQDVLLRLLADGPASVRMVLCRDRILPEAVVSAVLEHPDTRTRSFFARNPHVDPAQRAQLVDDPQWFVRAHLAAAPRVPRRQFRQATARRNGRAHDQYVRRRTPRRQLLPADLHRAASVHAHPSGREGPLLGGRNVGSAARRLYRPHCWQTPTSTSGNAQRGTCRARIRRGRSANCLTGRATHAGTSSCTGP